FIVLMFVKYFLQVGGFVNSALVIVFCNDVDSVMSGHLPTRFTFDERLEVVRPLLGRLVVVTVPTIVISGVNVSAILIYVLPTVVIIVVDFDTISALNLSLTQRSLSYML